VFALVGESRRRALVRRATSSEAEARQAEVFDLSGVGREHLADALAASLTVPVATEMHPITFAAESYWRGETHRLCDRPGSITRLFEEVVALGAEQVILISAAPEAGGPHALFLPRLEGRARLGEYVQSSESAALRDLQRARESGGPAVFQIRPAHNPIGPFDFTGGFDDRSDRPITLPELMGRGYEDAYRQFIEPMLGASGDELGQSAADHLR
jgi:hypothetical protein